MMRLEAIRKEGEGEVRRRETQMHHRLAVSADAELHRLREQIRAVQRERADAVRAHPSMALISSVVGEKGRWSEDYMGWRGGNGENGGGVEGSKHA